MAFVYFHDQGLSHRDYNGFTSFVSSRRNAVFNCVSTSRISEDDGVQGIAHELAHVLGAADRYNYPLEDDEPCCDIPEGIPEPDKIPLFPQEKACLMCEGILLSERSTQGTGSLDKVVICPKTAREIGWIN